jgi:signal transduction histidine kinase
MRNKARILSLIIAVVAITCAHYFITTRIPEIHDILQRLYYVPIIFAAFWYGWRGGLVCSVIISILYVGHIYFHWGGHPWTHNLEKTLEIILYNVIAVVTGILSQGLINERKRYQAAAEELKESYAALKEQTGALLEAEEQLQRANRLSALGELSAGMAHEIRNPLASIKGSAEILADKFKPQDKEYEFAQIMIKEVERLNRVITEFLDFARPKPAEVQECSLDELLKSVLLLTQKEMERNRVGLVARLDGNLPRVRVDPEPMKQVFLNLIINAIQAMPKGGELRVSTAVEDGKIVCSIGDTGTGIPERIRQRIFDPFFTTKPRGTGLGLSIVHKIVHRLGGEIQLESQENEGTVFRVIIPAEAGGGHGRKDYSIGR